VLSKKDAAAAEAQGWRLEHIYDLKRKRVLLTVMPVDFPMVSAWAVQGALVRAAKAGDRLAVTALRAIAKSNVS